MPDVQAAPVDAANQWLERPENVLSRKSVKPQVRVAGVTQVTHRPT